MKVHILFYTLLLPLVSMLPVACHESPYMQGKRLYEKKCQSCHMEDGTGLGNVIAPLSSSPLLGTKQLSCIIRNGRIDTIRRGNDYIEKNMPAFPQLSVTEVTNIVNYMNHRWYSAFRETTILEMEGQIQLCAGGDVSGPR